tara:strand:+ start:254 stop:907 length:654 start_codon:yes stop_codon:yes gene_type:complete
MNNQIIIIGAGGHGLVVASEILRNKSLKLLGFVDDNKVKKNLISYKKINYKVLGTLDYLKKINLKKIKFVCAIGDIRVRKTIVNQLNKKFKQIQWVNVISENANISPLVKIGLGNMIIAGSTINIGSILGNHSIINTNASIDHHCKIGNFINISPGTNIAGNVTIKDYTNVGMNCAIKEKLKIGRNVMIGANSFVNKNCDDYFNYIGSPIKKYEKKT